MRNFPREPVHHCWCKAFFLCAIFVTALLPGHFVVADDAHTASELDTTPSAFGLFKRQAEQGDMAAQYNLAVMYETGWSVVVDNQKAVRWFRAAARQGDANAQLRLGMLYYLGLGAGQSNIKGEKWIRKAAKQKQLLAQKMDSLLFVDDLSDELSRPSVMSRVRTAYLKNESDAVFVLEQALNESLQQVLRAKKQKEESTMRQRRAKKIAVNQARPGFSAAAKTERLESEVPAFIAETSLKKNRTQKLDSISAIRLQAEKGQASAQYDLARIYEQGIKLPVDIERAMEWFEKSARQGYVNAEYRLGINLFYGTGVTRDEPAGKKWLTLAAGHGHSVAKNLMDNLRGGSDVRQQKVSLAVRWYLERILKDEGQAAFHLGKIYEHGWGVARDLTESIKWYRRAGQAGNVEANILAAGLLSRTDNAD